MQSPLSFLFSLSVTHSLSYLISKYKCKEDHRSHRRNVSIANRSTCCPTWKKLDEENSADWQIGRDRRPSPIWQIGQACHPVTFQ